jgi:hypothetical protein
LRLEKYGSKRVQRNGMIIIIKIIIMIMNNNIMKTVKVLFRLELCLEVWKFKIGI